MGGGFHPSVLGLSILMPTPISKVLTAICLLTLEEEEKEKSRREEKDFLTSPLTPKRNKSLTLTFLFWQFVT